MKTKTNITKLSLNFLIVTSMIFSIAFLSSCEKTDDAPELTAEEALAQVQDETLATELFDEVIEIGEEAEPDDNTKSSEVDVPFYRLSCANVTRNVNFLDRTTNVTIDFGSENCQGTDGKFRRGKIIIARTGFFWLEDVTASYTFENYFVNDNELTGTKTYAGSFNEDGTYSSTFTTDGQIILADNAGTITWNSSKTRTVVTGARIWGFADNRVEVTGYANGTTADGITFNSTITKPLVRTYAGECFRYYVAGVVEITKGDGTEITINYGDETCDNLADITINGASTTVILGSRFNF